jgi:1-deoxy-D-xylulose-5-phosphate reductoisomerase
VLNAANEIAVAAFLANEIGFTGIPALVEATLDAAARRGVMREPGSIADAISVDHESRMLSRALLPEIAAKAI